jgi:hypothetical protein
MMRIQRLPIPLLAVAFCACLPNPQSVKERRQSFDRSSLRGTLIFESPPSNMVRVDAEFGIIKLVGYTLDPAVPKRGDRVEVRFYWSTSGTVDEEYQVFVHGDAIGGGARRIHGDHFPAEGLYPTDVWQPGEIIVDSFTVRIPSEYGPSQLGLNAGLYLENFRVPLTNRGAAPADKENRSQAVTMTFPAQPSS